jgi:hypothetical protein
MRHTPPDLNLSEVGSLLLLAGFAAGRRRTAAGPHCYCYCRRCCMGPPLITGPQIRILPHTTPHHTTPHQVVRGYCASTKRLFVLGYNATLTHAVEVRRAGACQGCPERARSCTALSSGLRGAGLPTRPRCKPASYTHRASCRPWLISRKPGATRPTGDDLVPVGAPAHCDPHMAPAREPRPSHSPHPPPPPNPPPRRRASPSATLTRSRRSRASTRASSSASRSCAATPTTPSWSSAAARWGCPRSEGEGLMLAPWPLLAPRPLWCRVMTDELLLGGAVKTWATSGRWA